MALTEQVADPTRRVFWLKSYNLDVVSRQTLPQTSPFTGTESELFLNPGSVFTGTQTVSWSGNYISALNPFFNGRYPTSITPFPFVPGSNVLYVDGSSGQVVGAPGSSFPAGSLPLYQLTLDAAFRFQTVTDQRPSTAGMQSSPEVVSNNLFRASYGASFSISELTAQNSGAYAFQIGTGTVSATINGFPFTLSLGGGWFTSGQPYGVPGPQIQFYVHPLGNSIESRSVSGNASQFPASALLPLALLSVDGVGRIMELDDYRPA